MLRAGRTSHPRPAVDASVSMSKHEIFPFDPAANGWQPYTDEGFIGLVGPLWTRPRRASGRRSARSNRYIGASPKLMGARRCFRRAPLRKISRPVSRVLYGLRLAPQT